ncbi:hypothetical protein HNQ60_004929 [Povalibacter uvarum]|uniref:Uncharacterized protein n=1 Tax=Povalibacter uvarum TaxID=732238 RepID=A0A841HVU9_9GAMM|nr:hypothetical protein [Povalibacter uvarum]MBB6096038.1 hypothetical protein [Povalibacter uvarum]
MHYMVVAPPVLFFELLGDLSKYEAERADGVVATLSRNLHVAHPRVCSDARDCALASLMGHPVPMEGRIPMPGGIRVPDPTGGYGIVFDHPPELDAVLRWHVRRFTDDERAQSLHYRESIKSLDMEAFQKQLRKLHPNLSGLKSIRDVVQFVDTMLAQPTYQRLFVSLASLEAKVPARLRAAIMLRWDRERVGTLQQFAPYAHHFLRVSMTFYIGLQVGAITTRKTNWIDLEYLRYLPFCHAFSTGDQLQLDVASEMLRLKQEVVPADVLKADMARLAEWWQSLSEEERVCHRHDYGSQPPPSIDSHAATVWQKNFGPPKRNTKPKMTDEERKALYEEFRPRFEAMQKALQEHRRHRK